MKEKDEDIERFKNIQLDLHKDFIEVVEKSRGTKLKKDMGIELFSGEFWSGRKAKELGLVDGIGNADQILKEKFGDGIMSAIDFSIEVDKVADPKGDRVLVKMCGKFLPYKKW